MSEYIEQAKGDVLDRMPGCPKPDCAACTHNREVVDALISAVRTYSRHDDCYDCGRAYGGPGWMDAVVPNEVWLRISPTGDEGGILCVSCMAQRCVRLGLDPVPLQITSGPFAPKP